MSTCGRQNDVQAAPDNVCVCFHVPLHKILKYIRLEQPRVASQISECYGAGTGCGWCIPFLEHIFEQTRNDPRCIPQLGLSGDEYLARRKAYLEKIRAQRLQAVEQELAGSDDLIE